MYASIWDELNLYETYWSAPITGGKMTYDHYNKPPMGDYKHSEVGGLTIRARGGEGEQQGVDNARFFYFDSDNHLIGSEWVYNGPIGDMEEVEHIHHEPHGPGVPWPDPNSYKPIPAWDIYQ